jgi:hypothetical protein
MSERLVALCGVADCPYVGPKKSCRMRDLQYGMQETTSDLLTANKDLNYRGALANSLYKETLQRESTNTAIIRAGREHSRIAQQSPPEGS